MGDCHKIVSGFFFFSRQVKNAKLTEPVQNMHSSYVFVATWLANKLPAHPLNDPATVVEYEWSLSPLW